MGWYSIYRYFKWLKKEDYPNMIFWYKEYYLKTDEKRKIEKIKAINTLMVIPQLLKVIN